MASKLAVDDREALARIRLGDEAVLSELFRTHYAELVRYGESIVGQRAVAEELVQDVFLSVWRRRATLTIGESLRGYLWMATRNRAWNVLRHDRIAQTDESPDPESDLRLAGAESADADLLADELDVAVERSIATLSPRCREVFKLSRHHGLTYGEIAQALGISVKTVEAQMGKALRILREQLAPWLPLGHDHVRDESP
jgi:RNA polymerase sigma-70 factor (ECF subfamily)